MRRARPLTVFFFLLASRASPASAHEDGAQAGVRTAVSLPAPASCTTSSNTVKELDDAYYTRSEAQFFSLLGDVLISCRALLPKDEFVVVIFLAKPTAAAEKPSVLHVVLHQQGEEIKAIRTLPGISWATWIYLTDDSSDLLRMELVSTAVENPLIGQLGALAGKVIGVLPGTLRVAELQGVAPPPEKPAAKAGKTIYVSRAAGVGLPFTRGSITETLYIQRTVKKQDPETKKEMPAPVQYDAKTVFENVPYSWLTLHAGVGVLSGKLHGVPPAKVEDDKYASEPLKRAATLAGVSFHLPFDPTTPTAGWQERLGFMTAAVITPAVGLYIGPSFGWRSFSFTAGPAWMWTPSPPPDFKIGDPVKKPEVGSDEEQLVFGKVRAWLIGGAYAFGK